MRRITALAMIIFGLIAPAMANASPHPDQTEDNADSVKYTAAYEMAELQQGGSEVSEELQVNLTRQVRQAYEAIPEFISIEADSPGFLDELIEALMPVMVRQVIDTYPKLYNKLAILYAETLTLEEIESARLFFASESYQIIRSSTEQNLDVSALINQALIDENGEIDGRDLENVVSGSVMESLDDWNEQTRRDLIKFAVSPAGRKLRGIGSQRLEIETAWTNESSTEEDLELEKIVEVVIAKHIYIE